MSVEPLRALQDSPSQIQSRDWARRSRAHLRRTDSSFGGLVRELNSISVNSGDMSKEQRYQFMYGALQDLKTRTVRITGKTEWLKPLPDEPVVPPKGAHFGGDHWHPSTLELDNRAVLVTDGVVRLDPGGWTLRLEILFHSRTYRLRLSEVTLAPV